MNEPYLRHGKITVICKCGVKTEIGVEHVLMKKYPKICKACG